MTSRLFTAVGLCLLISGPAWAGELKSGPQAGAGVGAFHPKNILNAEDPKKNGSEACLVWQHGAKPVAMIFAREVSDPLTGLVKQLDAEVIKNNKKMAAFVVFLSDDSQAEAKIQEMMEKHGIKNVSLAISKPSGPFKGAAAISPEADVTVIYYVSKKVKVNHAFRKGEFTEDSVGKMVAELPQILKK